MKKDARCPKSGGSFEKKDIVEIIITFVKSPTEFYGIDHRMLNDVQKLKDEMNAWYSGKRRTIEFPYIPESETFCAAFVENNWHRARVISHGNDACDAFLIDSGEIRKIKLPALRWLEDRFFRIPWGASRFILLKSKVVVLKTVFVEIDHSFGSFPTNYVVFLSPEINEISGSNGMDYANNFENVIANDVNLECCREESPKRIVKMSFCISPNEFYLQLESEREKLVQLQNELQVLNAVPSNQPKEHWKVGQNCYVRTKMLTTLRERWYRGKILAIGDGNWKVFLRDYGNIVCVTTPGSLANDSGKFETIENAAIKCSLAFIPPTTTSEWSLAAIKIFHELYRNYEQLAVTLPQNQLQSNSRPVTLWGLKSVSVSALTPTICEWSNINKEMVLLAQPTEKIFANNMNLDNSRAPENKVEFLDGARCPKLISWSAVEPITQTNFTCVPTYVSDDLVIYFHSAEEEKNLKSMRETAIDEFTGCKNNNEIKWTPNEACMARFTDGAYYRAIIVTVTEKSAEVISNFIVYSITYSMQTGKKIIQSGLKFYLA